MKLIIDIFDSDYERIKDLVANDTGYTTATTVGTAYHVIANGLPYEERPQGEWIVTAEDNDGVHRICCPFCFYEKGSNNTDPIIVTFTNFPKFCENCGADMRGGTEE